MTETIQEHAANGKRKLAVLDLFSGIGGFSLGLERTGGFETVAFCEIEPFPRKVLAKHWPEVPIYDDVRTLTAERLATDGIAVDVITGGFPCQDISVAGKQAGIGEGTRSGLWSECLRLVSELRPKYAIFENVSNLLSGPSKQPGAWFATILRDLAQIGYNAEWHDIPASYVGAWHRRGRVWILAYPNKERCQGRTQKPIFSQQSIERQLVRKFTEWPGRSNLSASRFCNANDGIPDRVVRIEAAGNAVVPQIPELIGRAILEARQ
jgi:DNA (cytosine-5)-methyltransferase 1